MPLNYFDNKQRPGRNYVDRGNLTLPPPALEGSPLKAIVDEYQALGRILTHGPEHFIAELHRRPGDLKRPDIQKAILNHANRQFDLGNLDQLLSFFSYLGPLVVAHLDLNPGSENVRFLERLKLISYMLVTASLRATYESTLRRQSEILTLNRDSVFGNNLAGSLQCQRNATIFSNEITAPFKQDTKSSWLKIWITAHVKELHSTLASLTCTGIGLLSFSGALLIQPIKHGLENMPNWFGAVLSYAVLTQLWLILYKRVDPLFKKIKTSLARNNLVEDPLDPKIKAKASALFLKYTWLFSMAQYTAQTIMGLCNIKPEIATYWNSLVGNLVWISTFPLMLNWFERIARRDAKK